MEEIFGALEPEQRAELEAALRDQALRQVFFPTPKQQLVLDSKADIIGYGGAAGGGKSYLVTGLAATRHRRSSITRPQKNQCQKFVDELAKMLGTREGYSSQTSSFAFMAEGERRFIKFFGLDNPGDEEKQQGDDYDLKAYDEVTQMREGDIRYTLTWNRTDIEGQRVQAILTFNPPTTPEGRWVIKFFGPWLDKQHPNPAKDGELRWFATVGDDQDYEVAGPQPFVIKYVDGKPVPWYSFDAKDYRPEQIIKPKSRTFIRALVTDNPYYMKTGYIDQLQQLPEPLRSQMLNGDFEAGVEDDPKQLIPTKWIDLAMERGAALLADPNYRVGPMDSIGVDVGRGGNMGSTLGATGHDELVIAKRHGRLVMPLIRHKGVATDDGAKSAALVIMERRDEAPVHPDVVGVGTSTYDFLCQANVHTVPINGAAAPRNPVKGMLRFTNLRAELHWALREALDPLNPEALALPPDPKLRLDLAAPRWEWTKTGIKVESKDDIKKRLGRSPDSGDAVVNANIDTPKRAMIPGPFLNLPAYVNQQGGDYDQRRFKELEN